MLLILILVTLASIILYLHFNYQYWKKRGVPGPKPVFLLGNVGPCFFLKKGIPEIYAEIYNKYQNTPIVGIYRSATPTLILRDPEIIKEVLLRSFNHFHDNTFKINPNLDPLFGKNPFVLRGEEWKSTRMQLTPGFTSGKMKLVYPLVENVAQRLVQFIENQPKAVNGEGYEAKELCKRFTLNSVAICAFGLEAKCFEEENSKFKQLADNFFSEEASQVIKLFLMQLVPIITNIISIKFTPKAVEEKLLGMVTETLKYREENNIVRNDFLNILYQLKQKSNGEFTDIDVTAHAAGFFGDGYETSSIAMSFALYELARNPETQLKLRQEIDKAFEENNNKIPYDVIVSLPYLDGVLSESLRLHAPLGALSKVCTKGFNYMPKPDDAIKKSFVIEEGTVVIIPVYALHYDPKYYENPNKFEPERFIGGNREKIVKYTYLPFGEGPRACLGQRFGILQVKCGIAYVVRNFELTVNEKTKEPFKYDPTYFMTSPIGGLWLNFKKIY